MLRLLTCALFAAALISASPAAAQDTSRSPSLALARELLSLSNAEKVMHATFRVAMDAQVEQNPEMAPVRDAMIEWAEKYMSMEIMGEQLAAIYVDTFTEAELRTLVEFYTSPVGAKLAERSPEISVKAAAVGAEIATRFSAELQQMVQERMDPSATPPR